MNPQRVANNRSMPSATVIPVLAYRDVREAVEWLCRCFGFSERLRIADHRAQLLFDGGAIVVAGGLDNSDASSAHSVMVRVTDVEAHHRHAVANGVKVSRAPIDHPYGERQYSAIDLAGHVWTFSQSIADVDPASWGGELREGGEVDLDL